MTESPYAIAHDFALMVPAPDGVDDAIAEVMARHEAELDAVLERYGVALGDLLQPTWMRAVRVGDVEALRSPATAPPWERYAAGELTYDEAVRLGGPLEGPVPDRGCCGPGEACSSPACTGAPVDDGEACDPEACGGGCSRGGWVAPGDVTLPAEGEPIPEVSVVRSPREVFPEPRQDAAVFGAPDLAARRAPMYGGRDEDGL